ncbi:MAG: pyridoxal phosphate-dependent aminotransferase [Pseudomonadota bacterium]
MQNRLTRRIQAIKPSPTIAVTTRAAALKASGVDVIGLGAGEPDFDTPQFIKDAAYQAMQRGCTKYTAVDGTASLKDAIRQKFARDNQLDYARDQILVSAGAKHCLFNLFLAWLEPGDEAIIPAPYWVSYPDMVLMAEATPVILETHEKNRFKMSPADLAAAITPKTKLLVMNSPSNPSGIAYTPDELKALGAVLRLHPNVMIVSDDIYEHVLWTDFPFANLAMVCPDRIVLVNGVSKTYAMTGWRIGYAAGPKWIIDAMAKMQSQSTSNPCSIAQYAAEAALLGDQTIIKTMVDVFHERHDRLVAGLNALPGVRCMSADGTFYAFPNVSGAMMQLGYKDDIAFAEFLLQEAHVAVVPGTPFGTPGHVRLSYATSQEMLDKALTRLAKVLK